MPGITYGDAGTNRNITGITYGDAGTNRTLIEVWYGDGGVNRLVWPPVLVTLSNASRGAVRILPDPAAALARLGVFADGFVKNSANGAAFANNYQWLLSGVASAYDVRYTTVSGSVPSGMVSGAWVNLATDQIISMSRPGGSVGTNTGVVSVDISLAGLATPLATANFTLTATVS